MFDARAVGQCGYFLYLQMSSEIKTKSVIEPPGMLREAGLLSLSVAFEDKSL
jgi:hypothetical protein